MKKLKGMKIWLAVVLTVVLVGGCGGNTSDKKQDSASELIADASATEIGTQSEADKERIYSYMESISINVDVDKNGIVTEIEE